MAPGGVDLDKPFGQSPFAEIIEVGWGEVSMSSQPKTLSRANLLASGQALSLAKELELPEIGNKDKMR